MFNINNCGVRDIMPNSQISTGHILWAYEGISELGAQGLPHF